MFPKYPPVESVTILLICITLGNSLQNHHLFIKKYFLYIGLISYYTMRGTELLPHKQMKTIELNLRY